MNRQQFTERNGGAWEEFEQALDQLEQKHVPQEAGRLPSLFRRVCGDLSLAEHRMYGLRLCGRLNALVIRGFGQFHKAGGGFLAVRKFVGRELPALVRSEWRLFWLCMALFWLPFFAMRGSVWTDFSWVQSVLGTEEMAAMDEMYGKESPELERTFSECVLMFGFYIMNNTSIDFRIFGGGILFGLGTFFFLIANGVLIGAQFGYVEYAGDPMKIYRFACGHATFELLGMILAGMGGLRLGLGLLKPGRLSRRDALRGAGRPAVKLLLGGALLTVVAALIEGFWSAEPHTDTVRYLFAAVWPLAFAVYFLFGGRESAGVTDDRPGVDGNPLRGGVA